MSEPNQPAPGGTAYLRPTVKVEPLVCKWYAWPHLISPATLALQVAFTLLPLLKSFAANPSVHIAANEDPKMYGGPFMSLAESDLPAVRQLIEQTTDGCARLITVANDLRELAKTLEEKAVGQTLNDFYNMLPDSLKGLVELLYDANNHASVRLFEELLYDEDLTAGTQEIMLQATTERERHFFMSTPRLPGPNSQFFKMPFSDPRIDTLLAMRDRPGSVDGMARLLEVPEADLPAFREYFTETPPNRKPDRGYSGDGVRMRFFGHACVLFQTKDVAVLVDPFVGLEPGADGRLTFSDLPEFIDTVFITHNHQDHFAAEMLLQLRTRIGRIIVPANNIGAVTDPSMKLCLQHMGFSNIEVAHPFDRFALPGGELVSLPFTGEHADLNIYSKHALSMNLLGRNFMFLIDSDGRDKVLYEKLMRRVGKLDALFIGMECVGAPLNWLYEPLMNKPLNRRQNEGRRLCGADCERAWNIQSVVKAPQVFIYALGQDPWMKYIMGLEYEPDSTQLTEANKFIEQCTAVNVPCERMVSGREQVF